MNNLNELVHEIKKIANDTMLPCYKARSDIENLIKVYETENSTIL